MQPAISSVQTKAPNPGALLSGSSVLNLSHSLLNSKFLISIPKTKVLLCFVFLPRTLVPLKVSTDMIFFIRASFKR